MSTSFVFEFLVCALRFTMSTRVYNCPYPGCEKSYPLFQSLKRHWMATHGNGHYCEECDMHFSVASDWRQHLETRHFDRVLNGSLPNYRRLSAPVSKARAVEIGVPCICFLFIFFADAVFIAEPEER